MKRFAMTKLDDVKKFFSKFNKEMFAFDTETTDLKYKKLDIEGMSFCDGNIACYIDLIDNEEREYILSFLQDIFSNAKIVIAHNIVFDLKVLHKVGIQLPDSVELFDTMVAHHLIDENSLHGLKHLSETILGVDTTKYNDIKDHKSKQFQLYAIHDAEWTYKLATIFKEELKEQELEKLFREVEMPFQKVLLDMEVNGMLVDVDKVANIREELKQLLEELSTDMSKYTNGKEINFNSSQQLGALLFQELGLPIIEQTPSGKPSTGTKTIEALRDKHPFVELLHKYKIALKLLTSYFAETAQIISNIDDDNRVRPNFRDTGTKTGRLSCNQPNLQQLPKKNKDVPVDTRECFIAPEGYKMIACDYSGQELRVLTEITKEPVLIDTFNKGKDMHLSTANDFFNLNIPEEALYESNDLHEEYKTKYKSERNRAKVINFGMAYGKGAYGFSKDFGITEAEAEELLNKYFSALPGVKKSIDECHEMVRRYGYVKSMTGRRRRFEKNGWGVYPGGAYRQSFNFLIQGFSADMMRIAMIKVRELGKNNPAWGLKTIATVHDESVYEVKERFAEDASKAIKEAFETAVTFCIPVVAEVDIGDNYAQAK